MADGLIAAEVAEGGATVTTGGETAVATGAGLAEAMGAGDSLMAGLTDPGTFLWNFIPFMLSLSTTALMNAGLAGSGAVLPRAASSLEVLPTAFLTPTG